MIYKYNKHIYFYKLNIRFHIVLSICILELIFNSFTHYRGIGLLFYFCYYHLKMQFIDC